MPLDSGPRTCSHRAADLQAPRYPSESIEPIVGTMRSASGALALHLLLLAPQCLSVVLARNQTAATFARRGGFELDSVAQDRLRNAAAQATRASVMPFERPRACGGLWQMTVGGAVKAVEDSRMGVPHGHAYEVGVFQGRSMEILSKVLKVEMLWGLDSFEGLPESSTEQPGWEKGGYSSDPRVTLTKRIGKDRVGFVKGYYDASLTDDLVAARGMKPAVYLGIDCDLYESTIAAMDWAFRGTGVAVPGTVVGYDDWWVLPCSERGGTHPLSSGEGRAHREISERYDVEFVCIGGPCHHRAVAVASQQRGKGGACDLFGTWGPLFLVASIGKGRNSTGFDMSQEDVDAFMKTSRMCLMHQKLFSKGDGAAAEAEQPAKVGHGGGRRGHKRGSRGSHH